MENEARAIHPKNYSFRVIYPTTPLSIDMEWMFLDIDDGISVKNKSLGNKSNRSYTGRIFSILDIKNHSLALAFDPWH